MAEHSPLDTIRHTSNWSIIWGISLRGYEFYRLDLNPDLRELLREPETRRLLASITPSAAQH